MKKVCEANNIVNIAFILLILASLVIIINYDNNSNTLSVICKIVIFISLITPIAKILKKYYLHFLSYIYGIQNLDWCTQIEKPRLIFNILGIVCIAGTLPLLSSPILNIGDSQYLKYLICFFIWGIGIYTISISWTRHFIESLSPSKLHEVSQYTGGYVDYVEDVDFIELRKDSDEIKQLELPNQSEPETISEERQRLYDISISNGIIECTSLNTFDKIIKGEKLNTDEIFNFVYKSKDSNKTPYIRNLIVYVLIITNMINKDPRKANNNKNVVDFIHTSDMKFDNTPIKETSINSSAVTKARKNADKFPLYTLLTASVDGQS